MQQAVSNVTSQTLTLPPGSFYSFGGAPLICTAPINLTLRSFYSGAILDAEGSSHLVEISNGCNFTADRLVMLNGCSQTLRCSPKVVSFLEVSSYIALDTTPGLPPCIFLFLRTVLLKRSILIRAVMLGSRIVGTAMRLLASTSVLCVEQPQQRSYSHEGGSMLVLDDSQPPACNALQGGGAIYLTDRSTAAIYHSVLSGCSAPYVRCFPWFQPQFGVLKHLCACSPMPAQR